MVGLYLPHSRQWVNTACDLALTVAPLAIELGKLPSLHNIKPTGEEVPSFHLISYSGGKQLYKEIYMKSRCEVFHCHKAVSS